MSLWGGEVSLVLRQGAAKTPCTCRSASDFCTVKGAKASAVIYSLVETAGANGLSERGYLHIVLSNLPSMDFRQHPELLKDLMPWSNYMRSCFEQE